MDDRHIIIASNIHGSMTAVRGRYLLQGEGFELLSDGSRRSGGPGVEAGALDLLVSSLVSCALNAFRSDFLEAGTPDRQVEIFARVERDFAEDSLGTVVMECFIEQEDSVEPAQLVEEFTRRCRIYRALRGSLSVQFVMHPVDGFW